MTISKERVVCNYALGSPHGDDRVAWVIAERLAQDPNVRSLVHPLATPWDLVELLVTDCSVIVIDACAGIAAPGTVLRIGERELASTPLARHSTHGGSLVESLELGSAGTANSGRPSFARTILFLLTNRWSRAWMSKASDHNSKEAAPKPTLAVFKFASCDGCQPSLLDAEDELLHHDGKYPLNE
ncbi:MAG: hypothetical protein ABI614_21260, partial [Planctomycetota bacterium]